MPGPKSPLVITLTGEEECRLEHLVRTRMERAFLVQRARIVLLLARGRSISKTAELVGLARREVRTWGRRFQEKRLEGLDDLPRSGRPPVFSPRSGDSSGENRLRDAG
jgi:hypothetical protein